MGQPKIHRPKDPAAGLVPMFQQIVGTIFSMMRYFDSFWTRVKYSKPTSIYGFDLAEVETPSKVDIDGEKLIHHFYAGCQEFKEIWQQVLSNDVYQKLLEMREMNGKAFTFPTDLWARILYDIAVSYRDALCDRDQMMDSLIPHYFGRTFSFVKKTKRISAKQAEGAIEEDCMTFEKTKPYLVRRWTQPAKKT
jgi:glucosylglycerate synthase